MFDKAEFGREVAALYARGEAAAGRPESLRQRAQSYLDLYQASNGACVFALIAAHGAIWASWYLVCAKLAAMVLAMLDPFSRYRPIYRYRRFAEYVLALKEINRTVMIATYVIIHGIRELGPERLVAEGFPQDLVADYEAMMRAPESEPLRDLYQRHFRWEQERVVSDTLETAFERFDWPLMSEICQRPWVWFAYFRIGRSMNFRKFTDQEERVEKGLLAYDRAAHLGFARLAGRTRKSIALFNRFLPALRP